MERFSLVIGSQCAALNHLSFLPPIPSQEPAYDPLEGKLCEDLASHLAETLRVRGGWLPTLTTSSALLNPDAAAMKSALTTAFERAAEARGQLLVAFLGHGSTDKKVGYYLHAADSPAHPDDRDAVDVGLDIGRSLGHHAKDLDGLVLLIDACQTGKAIELGTERWLRVLSDVPSRLELLTAASKTDSAYGGCFTKTLIRIVTQDGIRAGGDTVLSGELCAPINAVCAGQTSSHLSLNHGYRARTVDQEDAGLWITPNPARPQHALTGRQAAGLLDQVARNVRLSPTQRDAIRDLTARSRLRVLLGPPGCGKTTVMAFLIRPDQTVARKVAAGYIDGAVFLDTGSTAETAAIELAQQLRTTVPGFADVYAHVVTADDASDVRLSTTDRELVHPLALLAEQDPGDVSLIIDGLDSTTANDSVLTLLRRLSDRSDTALEYVRVHVGARDDVDLTNLGLDADVLDLRPPTWADVRHARPGMFDTADDPSNVLPGGWLTFRLIAALTTPPTTYGIDDLTRAYLADVRQDPAVDGELLEATLAVLTAAGTGPVLPFDVLQWALADLDHPTQPPTIRSLLTRLGPVVQRGKPGQDTEHVGLAHGEIAAALSADLVDGE